MPPAGDRRRQLGLFLVFASLLLAAGLGGCGASNPFPLGSYQRGMFFVEQEMYPEAVSALDNFIRHNPTDSLAVEAQYHKAMTYMDMEEYPLAAVEMQILRKDYPTSDRVEEAYFQEGVAYLRQVGRLERDITGAYEARLQFLNFLREYPNSRFIPQVREYMQEISDMMVEKRLQQVKVYRQLGRYEAVAVTLDDVLREEAGSRLLDRVLMTRAEAALKLADPDTARTLLERLLTEFPDSPLTGRAGRLLRGLDGGGDEEDLSE